MSNNKNPISDAFETINQTTGGVAGQVAQGLKSAGKAATVDVAKGIAKAPVDIIREVLGDDATDSPDPNETSGAGAGSSTTGDDPNAESAALMKKIEEDRKKVAEKLRQHRLVLDEEKAQYRQSDEEKTKKEQEVVQEEYQVAQIKQLEVRKKKESLVVSNAKQMGGSHEVGRKQF